MKEKVDVSRAVNCTALMALTSYSWAVTEQTIEGVKLIVHNSFNEALDYLYKSDAFCYAITQTDSLRQTFKELDDYLNKVEEEELEKEDAILVG